MPKKSSLLVAGCHPGDETICLQGPINSVLRVQEALITYFGFKANDITFLADGPPTTNFHSPTSIPVSPPLYFKQIPHKTHREIIIEHLCNMIDDSNPGDTILFYYCGHGGRRIDNTHCNDTGYEEYMSLPDKSKITDSDLRYISEGVLNDRSFVIVADCCNSGGLLDETEEIIGFSTRDRDLSEKPRKVKAADLDLSTRTKPHLGILLSSCQSYQSAFGGIDWERLENCALFTKYLLMVIKETKGDVTYRSLVESIGAIIYKRLGDKSPIPGLYCKDIQADLKFLGGPSNV